MKTLVVYETMFGNTKRVAESIAEGISDAGSVSVTDVVDAPPDVPPGVDLLVLGGPTHTFSMSRWTTRQDAARRGASYTDVPKGIREWLQGLPDGDHPQVFVAFDTRVHMPLLPGAASRAATRIAKRLGFRVRRPESFLVEGYEGPLLEGELERARRWGHDLGMTVANTSARGEGVHEPL